MYSQAFDQYATYAVREAPLLVLVLEENIDGLLQIAIGRANQLAAAAVDLTEPQLRALHLPAGSEQCQQLRQHKVGTDQRLAIRCEKLCGRNVVRITGNAG